MPAHLLCVMSYLSVIESELVQTPLSHQEARVTRHGHRARRRYSLCSALPTDPITVTVLQNKSTAEVMIRSLASFHLWAQGF